MSNNPIYKIYLIRNTKNGKIYVGMTSKSVETRFKQHKKKARINTTNYYIHNAINKYGEENFKIILWEITEDINKARKLESDYIELFNTLDGKGYNLRDGGNTGRMSEKAKKKLSKSKTGNKLSEEHKKKISESVPSGKNHPNYEKDWSREVIERRSKISYNTAQEIKWLIKNTDKKYKNISKDFKNANKDIVYSISTGDAWGHINSKEPQEYRPSIKSRVKYVYINTKLFQKQIGNLYDVDKNTVWSWVNDSSIIPKKPK